jgi:hypothetical protein
MLNIKKFILVLEMVTGQAYKHYGWSVVDLIL